MLHLITLRHTRLGTTPLDEESARRRDFCLPDNTQHSQETSIHAPRQDSNSQSQQARDRRPRGHWDRHIGRCRVINTERISISFVVTAGETRSNLHNEVCLFPYTIQSWYIKFLISAGGVFSAVYIEFMKLGRCEFLFVSPSFTIGRSTHLTCPSNWGLQSVARLAHCLASVPL